MSRNITSADISRDTAIRELAKARHHVDGEIEIDPDAAISEGDDNGAYVQAWVWISFYNEPKLDKRY